MSDLNRMSAEKAIAGEDGHVWHERIYSSMQLLCCMNCGFIKNQHRPNKPCPGPVAVELRTSNQETTP